MDLQRFVDAVLTLHGCVTQPHGDGRVDVILGAPVAARLGVAEESRFWLRAVDPADSSPAAASPAMATDGVLAGYGTGVLGAICSMAAELGRVYRVELAPPPPKPERVEREADSVLMFQNGIARLEAIETCILHYLIVDFRYSALSEDRHEGLLAVALNLEGGGSSPTLPARLPAYLTEHPEARRPWQGVQEHANVQPALVRAHLQALHMARVETHAFRTRLGRRLHRDRRRVDTYYETLRQEVARRRSREPEDADRLQEKLAAIEAERRHKYRDLDRRYTVRLRLEPLAVLLLRTTGLALRIRLQRSKKALAARLGWNGVARVLDQWTCDSCGAETKVPGLCESLHRLCSACSSRCRACGRA